MEPEVEATLLFANVLKILAPRERVFVTAPVRANMPFVQPAVMPSLVKLEWDDVIPGVSCVVCEWVSEKVGRRGSVTFIAAVIPWFFDHCTGAAGMMAVAVLPVIGATSDVNGEIVETRELVSEVEKL